MNYNSIKKYISVSRLQRYEQICGKNPKLTLKLYQTNLRLSQAFYPILSLFEIVLRNAINNEMIRYYNDTEWLKNKKDDLVYNEKHSNNTYPITNDFLKNKITDIIRRNKNRTNNNKIVSELIFGFWTELYRPKYFKLFHGRPMRIFLSLPKGTSRNNISRRLSEIKDFRNRIYHNEPIIFFKNKNKKNNFNLQKCREIHSELKAFFNYLDIDYKIWTKKIDNVLFEIERAEFVHKSYPNGSYYTKRILLGVKHYRHKYL